MTGHPEPEDTFEDNMTDEQKAYYKGIAMGWLFLLAGYGLFELVTRLL